MVIEDRIYEVAKQIFGIDYEKYKGITGRTLFGVTINPEKKQFERLFGDFPEMLLPTINKQFHDTIAGYKVDVGGYFKELKIQADLFLLNVNNLNDSDKDLNSLIIHELCHMVIDSKFQTNFSLQLTEKDRFHGNKLYKKTDFKIEKTTRHTEEFCILLSAASEQASNKRSEFEDRWDCISSAMRYDMNGCLRQ